MSDIIHTLRYRVWDGPNRPTPGQVADQAADEIERLRGENRRKDMSIAGLRVQIEDFQEQLRATEEELELAKNHIHHLQYHTFGDH